MPSEIKTIETPVVIDEHAFARFVELGWIGMNGQFTDKISDEITAFLQKKINAVQAVDQAMQPHPDGCPCGKCVWPNTGNIIAEKVQIMARKKGTNRDWQPLTAVRASSVESAKAAIRERSVLLDDVFDFAIRVTTIEEYSERP